MNRQNRSFVFLALDSASKIRFPATERLSALLQGYNAFLDRSDPDSQDLPQEEVGLNEQLKSIRSDLVQASRRQSDAALASAIFAHSKELSYYGVREFPGGSCEHTRVTPFDVKEAFVTGWQTARLLVDPRKDNLPIEHLAWNGLPKKKERAAIEDAARDIAYALFPF